MYTCSLIRHRLYRLRLTPSRIMADFNTSFYLNKRFIDPEDKQRGVHPFLLKCIHEFYETLGSIKWNTENAKLLEFGGGPTLYTLISAAPFVADITFSDYASTNLKAVEMWRDCDPTAHNWGPYVSYVIKTLEGQHDNVAELVQKRIQDLRSKIKHISLCDIFKEPIVDLPIQELFDIVSSHFCIDPCSESIDEYKACLQKLAKLVKPGGYLHTLASMEESYWMNDTERCSHLYLTSQDVTSAYKAAGLNILLTRQFDIPKSSQNIFNDCKGIFYVAAQKPTTNGSTV